jgi:hypothetical protein
VYSPLKKNVYVVIITSPRLTLWLVSFRSSIKKVHKEAGAVSCRSAKVIH